MAVRVRDDGTIVCAAMFPAEDGDAYVDDDLHYRLSVEHRVLVTDSDHASHGLWWWAL